MNINLVPKPQKLEVDHKNFFLGNIFLKTKIEYDSSCKKESYKLSINENGALIKTCDRKGEYFAKQSLKQLEYIYKDKIPYMEIEDWPSFSYRGFMIDTARHYLPLEQLKAMIEGASLFKFNKFHWHLCDDQGWRIEIDQFPLLVEKGSIRSHSSFGRKYDPNPHGGYYTKDEIKEIVEFCSNRAIEVIPEIEIPGHVSALLHAYPHLSCRQVDVDIKSGGGIFFDILCAGREETFSFLFKVLDEVIALFPSPYIHIGGDEAPKRRWEECSHCQARLKEENLKSFDELQGYMMNRVYSYLQKSGKKAITWNESLRGQNLDKHIIIQNWREKKNEVFQWANKEGQVIVSDFFHYYVDYPIGMTSLKKTYMYDPIDPLLNQESRKNIIGLETPIWTEHISNLEKLSKMAFPRFGAVAERGWSYGMEKNYKDFEKRLKNILPMINKYGLSFNEKSWTPNIFSSLGQILKFFYMGFNKETIKNLLEKE